MTRDEAMLIVCDAADRWRNELMEYIAPASEQFGDRESAEGERDAADEINEAIGVLLKKES